MNRNYIDENMKEIMNDMTDNFPYCMHITGLSEKPFPWHWHEELELGFLYRGNARILTTEAEYFLKEGDIFFVNCNSIHMLESTREDEETIEIVNLFHPILLSGHFHSVFDTKYIRPILTDQQIQVIVLKAETEAARKILELLQKIQELQNGENAEFFIRNYLSEAWYYLYMETMDNPMIKHHVSSISQERIRTMISYICENYAEKITLEDIAACAGISTREATRSFKKSIGQSPIDYLTTYRLNNTKKLLRNTSDSIADIARENGFPDSAYYSRAFKKHFGLSPSEFRTKVNGKEI